MNNIPTMLIRDDFQAQHKDMLVSACCEPLSKEEIEARRKCRPISMKMINDYIDWDDIFKPISEAKIGSKLRVRSPKDYVGYWAK